MLNDRGKQLRTNSDDKTSSLGRNMTFESETFVATPIAMGYSQKIQP